MKIKTSSTGIVTQLSSDKTEELLFTIDDLVYVEANDNYSTFYWLNNDGLREKSIRISLSQLEKQLKNFPFISRCHKSFMVNLKAGFTISGNNKGYKLHIAERPEHIPVSRGKSKEVLEVYAEWNNKV